jgi:hypothetical protein
MTTGMDLASSTGWPVENALQASNLEIVRALWLAHRESRIDDMLAMVRPDVHWYPLNRPGGSMYEGHDGVRRMLDHAARTNGLYWVELDEVTESSPNVIRAAARVVRPSLHGPPEQLPIRLAITMRGGLVVRVETYPAR